MRSGARSAVAALLLAVAIVATAPAGGAGSASDLWRLDGNLARVAETAAAADAGTALGAARESGVATDGGRVRVVIEDAGSGAEPAVRAVGGEVLRREGGLVSALVPPEGLERLGDAGGLARVRAPFPAVPAVVGQGVSKLNASAWHAAAAPGFRGAGVHVAVIDLGFGGLQTAIGAGDLPAGVEVVNRCRDRLESTTHGTAVAEIVHEVAPGAELTLICVVDEVDLAQALADAKARGVKVIVHSVLWLNTSRGDGSGGPGTPDALAADARANGILWVNATGNHALKHWSGTFTDANGDRVHEFAPGDTTNGVSPSPTGEVCAYLKWDEWPVTDEDFDVELVLPDGTVVASSNARQNGDDTPTDAACASGGGNPLAVRIRRVAGTGTPRFDLFWIATGSLEYRTAAGSVAEPATSPLVLGVGAVCSHTQALEPFSSHGPTIGGVTKPDLVSYDAVSTTTFGASSTCSGTGSGFLGTSAATPHVGGAAALVLEERPGLTPAQVEQVLEGKTVDMAPAGVDADTGHGRLFLSVDPPTPSTAPASLVEQTTATVAGTIDPPIARTTYRIEYGSTQAYGSATAETPAGGSAVAAPLTGLAPETAYHYRVVATNPFGTGQAADGTFTTLAYRPPSATTGGPGGVGSAGATLGATVNPNGKPTAVSFELGPTPTYGLVTGAVALPAGNASVAVAVPVTGLAAATTYHFRVVAENELGRVVGADQVLTTTAAPPGAGGGRPDLEVIASADRATAHPGDSVRVRVRVRLKNAGAASSASDAVLTAVLPAGAELVSAAVNRGPGCTGASTLVCPLSFISATATGELELVVRLLREGTARIALSVHALEQDLDAADNAATVAVTVARAAGAAASAGGGNRPPKLVLRRPAAARLQRAVARGATARVPTDVSVDEPARLRLRVLDLKTGRTVRLAAGSRLGPTRLRARAVVLASRLARPGVVHVLAVVDRTALVRGRRYALELSAVDAGGRAARLRVRFTR
jgi:hypothetical protein